MDWVLARGVIGAPESVVFVMVMFDHQKNRLSSLITQKVSRQVFGESTINKRADTSGKKCVCAAQIYSIIVTH